MSHADPPAGFVPAAEACERLGISDRTLRRRVAAGTIEGEYLPRPQGSVLYVKLPDDVAPQAASETAPPSTPPADQEGSRTADTRLLDQLADLIERNTALHDRIAALEREAGQAVSDATHAHDAARIERERRLTAEALAEERRQELERLRARRWYDPRTW